MSGTGDPAPGGEPAEPVAAAHPLPVQQLVAHFRRQSLACGERGSPMYAALMAAAADDLAGGGPVADVLRGWAADPGPAALALRLFGAVHRLALGGQAPELARYYPSVSGAQTLPFEAAGAWSAVRELLAARAEQVRAGLAEVPQTNEVGRSSVLVGGLLILGRRFGLPVHLVEIGASAGLNLRADHMRIALAGGAGVGPARSPVVLTEPWRGAFPPLDQALDIVSRRGSDRDPVDLTAAGRLRLASYIWPDQPTRMARLRGAFELARAVPAELVRADAAATVTRLEPAAGALTVVWHSVMWQYLAQTDRSRLTSAFDRLGAAATAAAPVARLSLEPHRLPGTSQVEFLVRLQSWPGRGVELLGSAHPHGEVVVWRGSGLAGEGSGGLGVLRAPGDLSGA